MSLRWLLLLVSAVALLAPLPVFYSRKRRFRSLQQLEIERRNGSRWDMLTQVLRFSGHWVELTRGLLASIPKMGAPETERLSSIGGTPPEPGRRPPGCPFAPRCALAIAACTAAVPQLTQVPGSDPRHRVACIVTTKGAGS